MEHNKRYNTRNIVRLRILIAMLVLSSLFATTFASEITVVSSTPANRPLYFEKIPSLEYFQKWKNKVMRIVNKYDKHKDYKKCKPKEQLQAWLTDIETLEKIIGDKEEDKQHMNFIELVKKYQVEERTFGAIWCAPAPMAKKYKLLCIGKPLLCKRLSMDPGVAVVDELYRAYMRAWELCFFPTALMLYKLCIKVAREDLEEDHPDMVEVLSASDLKKLKEAISSGLANVASSISSLFRGNTAQRDKDNKND